MHRSKRQRGLVNKPVRENLVSTEKKGGKGSGSPTEGPTFGWKRQHWKSPSLPQKRCKKSRADKRRRDRSTRERRAPTGGDEGRHNCSNWKENPGKGEIVSTKEGSPSEEKREKINMMGGKKVCGKNNNSSGIGKAECEKKEGVG